MPDFIRKWYPIKVRGLLFGIVVVFVSLVSFVQIPLANLAEDTDNENFVLSNYIVLGTCLSTLVTPIYLYIKRQEFVAKFVLTSQK